MTAYDSASTAGERGGGSVTAFRTIVTAYSGALLAGLVLSSVDRRLPVRIGRTLARRLTLVALAAADPVVGPRSRPCS